MQHHSTPKNSIQQVYGKVIILALLTHVLFILLFLRMGFIPLVIYNLFSMCFYIAVYILSYHKHFRSTVILIHLEICLFVAVSSYFLGWELGFSLYLVALSSLVYFCPFKRKYIPYLFSLFEIIVFFALKIYTLNYAPIYLCDSAIVTAFYIFNSTASFTMIVYGAFISKVSAVITEQTLTESNHMLQDMVAHDSLTGLFSRRHLIDVFHKYSQKNISFSIALSDIDNFKRINDTYGHECGDYVLSEIARIMSTHCMENAVICRWGGEEFVILLPDFHTASSVASIEKIRSAIDTHKFTYQNHSLHVTMTFGISTSDEACELNDLIRLADKRMYYGKQSGKNTIITQNMKYPN